MPVSGRGRRADDTGTGAAALSSRRHLGRGGRSAGEGARFQDGEEGGVASGRLLRVALSVTRAAQGRHAAPQMPPPRLVANAAAAPQMPQSQIRRRRRLHAAVALGVYQSAPLPYPADVQCSA